MPAKKNQKEDNLTEQLQRLLVAIQASKQAVLPDSNDALLKSVVEAAGRIFGAAAASILLVHEQEQALEFKVAYGASNRDLVGTKFPLDKGIAGYVVMTGQPIAISNVRQDARFNQDFAKSTGYVPTSILATPLLAGDRVIGVMEVLDKLDAASFGMQDMELLGIFARQAAIAIDQSQQMGHLQQALVAGLKKLVSDPSTKLESALDGKLADQEAAADLLELAGAFNEIAALGDPERKACLQVLKIFAEYRRSTRRMRA